MKLVNLELSRRVWSAVGVFVAWTLTSFLCHECAKMFLNDSKMYLSKDDPQAPYYRFLFAAIITAVQCSSCLLLVRIDKNIRQSRAMQVLVTSHVLATLATNYSMVFIEAASTLAIKLLEPIAMTIAHHVVFQKMVPLHTVSSVPLIICGAFIFTVQRTNGGYNTEGISLALASNIILAARNITLKKMQHESAAHASVVLKPVTHIALTIFLQTLFLVMLYYLDMQELIPKHSSKLVVLSLASGIFHVAYSYISTSIVLQVMNVVSHSIANIFKRLLVVLMLCALGTRHVTATNFLGLGIAVAGLLIHTLGKISSEDSRREGQRRKAYTGLLVLSLVSVTVISSSGTSTWLTGSRPSARQDLDIYLESHGLNKVRAAMTDFSHISDAESDPEMQEFLSWRLVDHPEDTDKRSKTLTTNKEVVEEAQRILVNLMQDLLGSARHVMLIDTPTFENKGDPAIVAGEVLLMRKLKKTIVYSCETLDCKNETSLLNAKKVNKRYAKDDLVILMNGGGNIVGYPIMDIIRSMYINAFPDRRLIMLSQSIWLHGNYTTDLNYARSIYSNRTNLVMFIRDRQSLEIAKAHFKGVKLILAPDLAFCIGMVPRQMPPLYDIIWLRRTDKEAARYKLKNVPANISVDVSDWLTWKSNEGHMHIEHAFMVAAEGFQFLQRGRIVVTERVHGHILSILLNMPHVLIDNPPYFKLSSFDKTWTQGLSNTILVSNGTLALAKAIELLKHYKQSLPSIGPRDMFALHNYKIPEEVHITVH